MLSIEDLRRELREAAAQKDHVRAAEIRALLDKLLARQREHRA